MQKSVHRAAYKFLQIYLRISTQISVHIAMQALYMSLCSFTHLAAQLLHIVHHKLPSDRLRAPTALCSPQSPRYTKFSAKIHCFSMTVTRKTCRNTYNSFFVFSRRLGLQKGIGSDSARKKCGWGWAQTWDRMLTNLFSVRFCSPFFVGPCWTEALGGPHAL